MVSMENIRFDTRREGCKSFLNAFGTFNKPFPHWNCTGTKFIRSHEQCFLIGNNLGVVTKKFSHITFKSYIYSKIKPKHSTSFFFHLFFLEIERSNTNKFPPQTCNHALPTTNQKIQ